MAVALSLQAQKPSGTKFGPQIPGPDAALQHSQSRAEAQAGFEQWLSMLKSWRAERLKELDYNDAQYRRPELLWAQRNFVQPQVMAEERYLYDPVKREYTVARFLGDVNRRYGGLDSVLIWPVYPNIGIDTRNQWDLLRDMPGGVSGVKHMVEDFHARGVKVFFPTMPWDNGTRDIGMPYERATAELMAEIEVDGINGDTWHGLPYGYRAASDATKHALVLEPELAPSEDQELMWNNQSWGYWDYSFVPTVSRLKWLEPRHMINVCERWARDRTDGLQFAFFNGVGYESWENVWGIWNQLTFRDAEALRRIARIERALPQFIVSSDWEPHTPTLQPGVFASKFTLRGSALWTLVNRNKARVTGGQILLPFRPGRRYYDLWHGTLLTPKVDGETATLAFEIEELGFGAVLSTDSRAKPGGLAVLLKEMQNSAKIPLNTLSSEWHFLPQQMVRVASTQPARQAPPGMIFIPGKAFDFRVHGVEIEGEDWGVDVQYPWEDSPRRSHQHRMILKGFYIDRFPVTNAEFLKFLDASHYRPDDDHNFLRDWQDGGPRPGWEQKPVTWVSLEDARAYAKWAGKRLPHEWEWQYAAQGDDARVYPWGKEWNSQAVPTADKGRQLTGPADVNAHPLGRSPYGVMDMVGNVWQWTDEFIDEHTRGAMLRGGSYYQAQGSNWYFPEAYKLDEHGKYLLMAPSKDRAGTIGFRCVVDSAE